MMKSRMPALVSTDWLAAELGAHDLRVVDGSFYLPAMQRDAEAEYLAAHVPGAVFFDLDASSAQSDPRPHMLPDAAAFAERMGQLGIGDEHRLVVYDGSGINLSAPRVWWMFRVFGHPQVAVLDGGFAKWRLEGRPIESGPTRHAAARFTAALDAEQVRDLASVVAAMRSRKEQIVDVRAAGRFEGRDPEPRPGMRGGHIPGSRNLPFQELVGRDGTVLPVEELRARILAAGIDPDRPIVATCGSGVTACALVLALDVIGARTAAVYDGSWSEWGAREDVPVVTGSADG